MAVENSSNSTEPAPAIRPRNYSRWRAGTLTLVYVLMGLHLAHWRLYGTTLAPLELSEVMYTFEAGIVTAGFLLMATALLSVLIFGRFFCSWACHILALEDLCAWLLKKAGVKPKVIRSRLLLLVPLGALFYMFVWPQITRIARGKPMPKFHVVAPDGVWASWMTDDYWRNLPGPWIAAITFLICGFVIVYVLGSRAFCMYGCPYGALFAIADRLAPGRIVRKHEDCADCGACTRACKSNILVHEELQTFGTVVSPACLKDLDCVAACPNGSIGFGFTKPAGFKSWQQKDRPKRKYDLALPEELLVAVVFLASLFIFRGLYDAIPFLMTLGVGAIFGFLAVITLRLLHRSRVAMVNIDLKRSGLLTKPGMAFVFLAMVLTLFTGHSAYIRYHEFQGMRQYVEADVAFNEGRNAAAYAKIPGAIDHLTLADQWGLFHPAITIHRLAALHRLTEAPQAAVPYLRRLVAIEPDNIDARSRLAMMLIDRGDLDGASAALERVDQIVAGQEGESTPAVHSRLQTLHTRLAGQYEQSGRAAQAARHRQLADQLGH